MSLAERPQAEVPCFWCKYLTHPWPYSGEHKHKWRWCSFCETSRDEQGQAFAEP